MDKNIIENLRLLQKKINNGRGISCVDTIIFFLENKKINEANACIINEWDKICGYPILEEYVKNNICNPCYL